MAKVVHRESELERKYRRHHSRQIVWGVIAGIMFFLWGMNIFAIGTFNPWFLAPVFFGWLLSGIIYNHHKMEAEKLDAGLRGTDQTRTALSDLPDDYYVVQDACITTARGGRTVCDHLVISRNGIRLIETTNMVGEIRGCAGDEQLQRRKLSSSGMEYLDSVRNPVKSTIRKREVLKAFLTEHGFDAHVLQEDILYFSNSKADVQLTTDGRTENRPMIVTRNDGGEKVLIEEASLVSRDALTEAECRRLVRLLIGEENEKGSRKKRKHTGRRLVLMLLAACIAGGVYYVNGRPAFRGTSDPNAGIVFSVEQKLPQVIVLKYQVGDEHDYGFGFVEDAEAVIETTDGSYHCELFGLKMSLGKNVARGTSGKRVVVCPGLKGKILNIRIENMVELDNSGLPSRSSVGSSGYETITIPIEYEL